MAIAGSPGIPSFAVSLRNGLLHPTSITTNKPSSLVESDMATALRRILAGETVQIDVRGGNFVTLTELYGEHQREEKQVHGIKAPAAP